MYVYIYTHAYVHGCLYTITHMQIIVVGKLLFPVVNFALVHPKASADMDG